MAAAVLVFMVSLLAPSALVVVDAIAYLKLLYLFERCAHVFLLIHYAELIVD